MKKFKFLIILVIGIFLFIGIVAKPNLKADSINSDSSVHWGPAYPIDEILFVEGALSTRLNLNGSLFDVNHGDYYISGLGDDYQYIDDSFAGVILNYQINDDRIANFATWYGGNYGVFNGRYLNIDHCDLIQISLSNLTLDVANKDLFFKLPYGSNFTYTMSYYTLNADSEFDFIDVSGEDYGTNPIFEIMANHGLGRIGLYKLTITLNYVASDFSLDVPLSDGDYNLNDLSAFLLSIDLNADLTGWLWTAIGGFLNAPIFGAITLGHLLLVIICIPLVLALLKYFAGG